MGSFSEAEADARTVAPDAMKGAVRAMKRLRLTRVALLAAAAVLLFAGCPAHAAVSLLLEQPYGGFGMMNPTGHSALYLDHVCAAGPLALRPCRPGELGVVVSRYDGITNHDWIAVPLLPYLYAVDSPADIPRTMDRQEEMRLRDVYRRRELELVAPDLPDGGTPEGNWYELVGSAYDRTIFGFSLATTPDQDARLIAFFNDRRNVQRYNGAFRNCADFARTTINLLYPHAIRRNFIADLGLSTPKSVARGLTHYASKHPETDLHMFVVPQVPGSIPRSFEVQGVTESLLKRYGVPLVVLSPIATGVVFVAYLGHGRFDMPRKAPVLDLHQAAGIFEEAKEPPVPPSLPSPPSLQLSAPSGLALRVPLPPSLFTHDGPPGVTDTPLFGPADRIPADLMVPSANE